MRLSALNFLEVKQISRDKINNEDCLIIQSIIGSPAGASKTSQGGLSIVREKPIQLPIFTRNYFDGHCNAFRLLDKYLSWRETSGTTAPRFFKCEC